MLQVIRQVGGAVFFTLILLSTQIISSFHLSLLNHLSSFSTRSSLFQLQGVDKDLRAAPLNPPPPPLLPKNRTAGLALFVDLEPLEIARQMTLMDWRIFSRIKPVELLNCAWSSEKLRHRSPNVLATSHTFNKWSNWVATIITLQPNVKVPNLLYLLIPPTTSLVLAPLSYFTSSALAPPPPG